MSKLSEFKSIIKNNNSDDSAQKFQDLINSSVNSNGQFGFAQEDVDLLLRWAVQEQKKNFNIFYAGLKKQLQMILNRMGANVNFIDKGQKKSNLMIGCENGSIEIVESLVNDPDINFKLEDGRKRNCLFYAIQNRNKEKGQKYIRLILNKCPSLLTSDKNVKKNNIPLIFAIEKSKQELVKTLLDFGADPNQKISDNGNTPIYEAVKLMKSRCTEANKQIVKYLLEKGADPHIRNNQKKNAIEVAEKYEQQVLIMMEQASKRKKEPDFSIKTVVEREEMFSQAAKIFASLEYLIQISDDSSEESEYEDHEPFQEPSKFIDSLTEQILDYSRECEKNHENGKKQLQKFLQMFRPISDKLNLQINIYGSFATKLWLKHCDIDLILIPNGMLIYDNVERYLNQIYLMLLSVSQTNKKFNPSILKTIKVPMIRVQMFEKQNGPYERKKHPRKFDITIIDNNHNGEQHVFYIKQLMHCFPNLQPLFYIIKKLSFSFKLNDPKQNGIRSYALILMIAGFLGEYQIGPNINSCLGQLLLGFLHKYGFSYEYDSIQNRQEQKSLMLNLPDPINMKNNVGNNTDAFSLQKMFRTAYIILHTKGCDSKLSYLFDARNMFTPQNF